MFEFPLIYNVIPIQHTGSCFLTANNISLYFNRCIKLK